MCPIKISKSVLFSNVLTNYFLPCGSFFITNTVGYIVPFVCIVFSHLISYRSRLILPKILGFVIRVLFECFWQNKELIPGRCLKLGPFESVAVVKLRELQPYIWNP